MSIHLQYRYILHNKGYPYNQNQNTRLDQQDYTQSTMQQNYMNYHDAFCNMCMYNHKMNYKLLTRFRTQKTISIEYDALVQ